MASHPSDINGSAAVDAYIAAAPEPSQEGLRAIRSLAQELIPQGRETISYGIPTIKANGNVIHFAGYRGHIGMYPVSAGVEAELPDVVSRYRTGKGTLQFPLGAPLPLDAIREVLRIRAAEDAARKRKTRS